MNALTKIESTALQAMTEDELIQVLQSSLYPGASLNSIKMVLGYCKATGLDPMRKPVHIVPMWDNKAKQMRDVIMPGVGLYRTDAARTGEYAGITEPEFGPDVTEDIGGAQITYPLWCRVTVSRRSGDNVATFTAREFWKENYATAGKDTPAPNAMWKKRPYGQIAKCAEAQALRKAFPEVGSQPTADEMEGKDMDQPNERHMGAADVVGAPPPPPAGPPAWPDNELDKRCVKVPEWQKAGKTADDVLAFLQTKGTLSDEQKARVRGWFKPAQQAEDVTPKVTYAQVYERMKDANTPDQLNEAAALIAAVADETQRNELKTAYQGFVDSMNDNARP